MTVTRAIHTPSMSAGVAIAAPPPGTPLTLAEHKAAATDSLRHLLTEISAIAPEELRSCVVIGRPVRQLNKLAVSERACLIVVGPRRHGALHEALFGSSIRRLLRRGTAPIMICPRADAALLADNAVPRATPVR